MLQRRPHWAKTTYMCRYGRSASRALLHSVSTMIFSLRSRRRAYHDAVSSNSEPPSASLSTRLDVRSATSATLMPPMLCASRARSCSPSQISRKNCGRLPCQPLLHRPCGERGPTDHVVAPVTHGALEIVGTAIRFAQSLEALDAEQFVLLLFGHTAHGTAQRRGQREVGLEIAEEALVHFVENGNLDVD